MPVDRLVDLSKDLPVHEVPLSEIRELDEPYWYSNSEVPTVRSIADHMKLVEELEGAYPIILGADGGVMDGMHRVARALRDGEATIRAVKLPVQIDPDYSDCQPDDLPYPSS